MLDGVPNKLPKGKCIMFLKNVDVITEGDFKKEDLIVIELSGATPFEHLEVMSKGIILPVLSNKVNHQRWGVVNAHELGEGIHTFISATSILCGQVKGDTKLPVPIVRNDVDCLVSDEYSRITPLLEAAITTWTRQIKRVLSQDPEMMAKQGLCVIPDKEIQFWKRKANHLNAIFEQLSGNDAKEILRSLHRVRSTYYDAFSKLCFEVSQSRAEANDNVRYLEILEPFFDNLSNDNYDIERLSEMFRPLLHSILLVWRYSKYYNTSYRLAVLIKEICDALIRKASTFVPGERIFQLIDQEETAEAMKLLLLLISVCASFKSVFIEYKQISLQVCPSNPWSIQVNSTFAQLDVFLERCNDVMGFVQTVIHFSKLPKIEIGSTKGRTLTSSIHSIFIDFQGAVANIKANSDDLMDIEKKYIDTDFLKFQLIVKEIEIKLASAICTGIDDYATVYGCFQLLDSFEVDLLNRAILKDEMEVKYVKLFREYIEDLQVVRDIFLSFKDQLQKILQDTCQILRVL